MDSLVKVRDVSLRYGVSNRALVYYEEMGLLQSVKCDGYAYRMYDGAALRRLEQIMILRRLNISIRDITLIFSTRDSAVLLDVLSQKVAGIDDEVALLHQLKQIIKDFIRQVRELYAGIVSALGAVLPNDTVASTQNGYPFEAWSAETRIRFADALTACKHLEQQAIDVITDALEHW